MQCRNSCHGDVCHNVIHTIHICTQSNQNSSISWVNFAYPHMMWPLRRGCKCWPFSMQNSGTCSQSEKVLGLLVVWSSSTISFPVAEMWSCHQSVETSSRMKKTFSKFHPRNRGHAFKILRLNIFGLEGQWSRRNVCITVLYICLAEICILQYVRRMWMDPRKLGIVRNV